VRYPSQTRVVDVGTDPLRYEGMKSLETALNPLKISKNNQILIRSQKGYVPPPLVGIWSRWPYFHNNSVPSLCALLMAPADRPKKYEVIAPVDSSKDFDFDCNGYPVNSGREPVAEYDSSVSGLSNSGHEEGVLLNSDEKKDLIHFLQTL
jgi:hypothetical protein